MRTDSEGYATYSYTRSYNGQTLTYYLHFYDEGLFYNGFWVVNDLETGYVETEGRVFIYNSENGYCPEVMMLIAKEQKQRKYLLAAAMSCHILIQKQTTSQLSTADTSACAVDVILSDHLQLLVLLEERRLGLQHWHLLANLLTITFTTATTTSNKYLLKYMLGHNMHPHIILTASIKGCHIQNEMSSSNSYI